MQAQRIAKVAAAVALLALAVLGGFFATSQLQRTVPIVPGVQGCWRLEGSARQTACLSKEFSSGAAETAKGLDGAERATAVIGYVRRADRLAADDDRLGGVCHPAMHELGRSEGSRAADAGKVPTYPTSGASQLCTAGYVHGLSEGYLAGTPDADVASVFPKLCHEPAARSGCAHGVGHALLRAHAGDRWKTAAPAAVDGCNSLDTPWPADCHDGVFMELAMRTKPDTATPDQYVDACRTADDRDAALGLSCWGYLGLSLTTNDVPIEDTPGWCAKAPGSGEFPCIEGYGRDLGVDDVTRCGAHDLRAVLVERCIEGAIGLQVGSGHVTGKFARSACGKFDSTQLVDYCRGAVTRYARGRAQVEAGADTGDNAGDDAGTDTAPHADDPAAMTTA